MPDRGDDQQGLDRLIEAGRVSEALDERRTLSRLRNKMFGKAGGAIQLSRYLLLDKLGTGGVGVVYRAHDPELDREVAVKLLRASSDRHQADDSLLREAKTMAKLAHPNVIAVYDVGRYDVDDLGIEVAGGAELDIPREGVFVVMELVDGVDLRTWLAEKRREWRSVVDIFLQAGRAVAAAHAAALAHGDFKPANVLIGGDGRARVVDFGLARMLGRAAPQIEDVLAGGSTLEGAALHRLSTLHTRGGKVMGTPVYMSPEQHAGGSSTDKSDQYSFCVSLYEALYGHRPFAGQTIDELEAAKLAEELVPPAQGSEVPQALLRVARRGLRAAPEDRFPSMDAVLSALQESIPRRRWPWIAAAAIAAVGASLILTTWSGNEDVCRGFEDRFSGTWDAEARARLRAAFAAVDRSYATTAHERAQQRLDAYTQHWVALRTEACKERVAAPDAESDSVLAERIGCLEAAAVAVEEATQVLLEADQQTVEHATRVLASLPALGPCVEPSGEPARRARALLGGESEAAAAIDRLVQRAGALGVAGRVDAALEAAKSAFEQAQALGHEPAVIRAQIKLAEILLVTGDPAAAEAHATEAVQLAERSGESHLGTRAMIVQAETIARAIGRHDEAERIALQAAARLQATAPDDEAEVHLAFTLGMISMWKARYADALDHLDRAASILERAKGADAPELTPVISLMGTVHYSRGDLEQAQAHHERALALYQKIVGMRHPDVAAAHNNLAAVLQRRGELERAREHFEQAVDIIAEVRGKESPEMAMTLANLGQVLTDLGDANAAIDTLRRSVALYESIHGKHAPVIGHAMDGLGDALLVVGKHEQARLTLERAVALHEAGYGTDHPVLVDALTSLGLAFLAEGDAATATEHLERAARILDASENTSPAPRARVQLALSKALPASSDRAKRLALDIEAAVARDPAPFEQAQRWLEQRTR
jgi:serine/threonine protein kinase/tetratricopeptide (TPR) repeat protein